MKLKVKHRNKIAKDVNMELNICIIITNLIIKSDIMQLNFLTAGKNRTYNACHKSSAHCLFFCQCFFLNRKEFSLK